MEGFAEINSDSSGSSVHAPVGDVTGSSDFGGDEGGAGESVASGGGAAESYTPPTREQWEEARKHADIGREFGPHADKIRQALQAGLSQRDAHAAVKEAKETGQTVKEVIAEWEKDPNEYKAMWHKFETSPKHFKSSISSIAEGHMSPKLAAMEAKYEKQLSEMRAKVDEVYGHAVLSQQAFQKDPKWQAVEKEALELVRSGEVRTVQRARQVVEQQRELAQLKAAAARGAQAGGTPAPAQAGGRRVPTKPSGTPRQDPALARSASPRGESRSAPGGGDSARKNESSFDRARRLASAEVRGG